MKGSRFYILFCLCLCLLSCRATGISLEELDRTTRDYNRMIRWQEYETAGNAFLEESMRAAFASRIAGVSKATIVDYRISGREVDQAKGTAVLRVEFDYYVLPSPTVKKVVDIQKWRYSEDRKGWYLESLIPEFK